MASSGDPDVPHSLAALTGWEVNGSQLTVMDGGVRRPATTLEVLEARAKGWATHGIPELRVSVKAIPVKIELSGDDPRRIGIALIARRAGQAIVVSRDQEHVVHAGTWYAIDHASRTACLETLANFSVGPEQHTTTLRTHQRILCSPEAQDLVIDEFNPRSDWIDDLPDWVDGLAADLYPYQAEGVKFLRGLAALDVGAVLADEMGLGKTLQAICLLLSGTETGPSLVVAPAGLMSNWRSELARFAPSLGVLVHAGPRRAGVAAGLTGPDVMLTSYETLVADLSFIEDIYWNIVVVDEAQLIKNPEARRAQAVKSLRRRIGVAVSGTPVENRLVDLWSICEFVVPSLLGTRTAFESRTDSGTRPGRIAGALASPITLRRNVADVAKDLPALYEAAISLDMTPEQTSDYRGISQLSAGLAQLTAQRVFCASATDDLASSSFEVTPKVIHLLEMVREILGRAEKALVFATFQASLDRLSDVLSANFPEAYLDIVDGRSGSQSRQQQIDTFSEFKGGGVLLLNPKAAGVGLNITAANHVIHFNPEWNPAITDQATARVYRRKQARPVMVHHLFYTGTVEDRVRDRVERKRVLIDDVNHELES